jgi:hypothetical protein
MKETTRAAWKAQHPQAAMLSMALGSRNSEAFATRLRQRGERLPAQPAALRRLLTVVITASASPLNPSTAILRELLLSLTFLNLPEGAPVLVSHDGPRLVMPRTRGQQHNNQSQETCQPAGACQRALEFPPAYLEYLANVQLLLPAASACTKLALRLLVRATNGRLAGNLAFAMSFVTTPYVLKVEHDHPFARSIDIMSVVADMRADPRLKYVRFNRRENVRVRCDNGDYFRSSPYDQGLAKALWGSFAPRRDVAMANNYTRTACFSDMNHLTLTAYYRTHLLPVMLNAEWGSPKVLRRHTSSRSPPTARRLWVHQSDATAACDGIAHR